MPAYALRDVNGHLLFAVDGLTVLIDTGCPVSVGRRPAWSFLGRTHDLAPELLGVDLDVISSHVGEPLDVLLGADLLASAPFAASLADGRIAFGPAPPRGRGVEMPLADVMGVPVVHVMAGEGVLPLYLDTGARLSYLHSDLLAACEPGGKARDFYPGFGEFETPIFRVSVRLGGESLSLDCGRLPPLLETPLLTAGVRGILGTELFRTFDVVCDLPRSRLRLCRRKGKAGK
jgi:hypothetical protein